MLEYADFSIKLHKNTLTIKFYESYEPIIKSLTRTKILLGVNITNNYTFVTLNANSIEKACFINENINDIYKLIHNIGSQLKYLITSEKVGLLGFSLDNFFIIDSNILIYIPNLADVCQIDDHAIMITTPFIHDSLIKSPELSKITTLPATIHFKTIYFSLGCVLIYILSKAKYDMREIENSSTQLLDNLPIPINESKIYYFIKRCLYNNPKDRCLLFI
jgi:hypothetical protein